MCTRFWLFHVDSIAHWKSFPFHNRASTKLHNTDHLQRIMHIAQSWMIAAMVVATETASSAVAWRTTAIASAALLRKKSRKEWQKIVNRVHHARNDLVHKNEQMFVCVAGNAFSDCERQNKMIGHNKNHYLSPAVVIIAHSDNRAES